MSMNATFTPLPFVASQSAGIGFEGKVEIVSDQSKEIGIIRFGLYENMV